MQDKYAVQDCQSGQRLKYQRVRASLAPVGVFPRKGTNPSSKMVKCPCLTGSTRVVAMPPWHPFKTVSSSS